MKIKFGNKDFEKAIKKYVESVFNSPVVIGSVEWVNHRKTGEISGEVEFELITDNEPETVVNNFRADNKVVLDTAYESPTPKLDRSSIFSD